MQEIKSQFLLNSEITYLNHGSFGACPKPIFEDYQSWQLKLEQEPVNFIVNTGVEALKKSKFALANYLNCENEDLVFMPNPTTALNTVIRSLNLKPDDEILTTNQEYGALEKTWKFYCKKAGAKLIKADIKLPLISKEEFLIQFWKPYSKNTKVIFLSQITSQTALIFPVKEIVDKAKSLGLITIIDGAHVPGHIPLNLKELDADVYTGACHKWMLTPKGSSFLHVKKSFQEKIDPLIVSWGYDIKSKINEQFSDHHQFNGTKDFTAYLTIPKALNWLNSNDWEKRTSISKQQLLEYYPIIASKLNSKVLCPINNDFLGQICSIPIQTNEPAKLHDFLYNMYKIEIPIVVTEAHTYIRPSFQAYNGVEEIEYLLDSLSKIRKETSLLK